MRGHYFSYLSEKLRLRGLFIIKATLGKTLQGKQEDRALAAGQAETVQTWGYDVTIG